MPEPHTSMAGGGGGLNKPCILLIIISGVERFAFKGVASNLVTYLTDVIEMKNSSAAKFVNSWVGFTSMLPLIVSMLADSYCDKYSTILASSLLYAAGLLALTSTAVSWPWAHSNKVHSVSSLCLSLYLISVGQGGYNPSLQAFGAEQLEATYEALPVTGGDEGKGSSDGKSWFFQWWYFGVCCGSLLGVSVMSYIQDTYGWGLGFAIPALSMIVSIVMFLCGARFYVQKQGRIGDVSVFEVAVQAVKAGVSKLICGGSGSLRNEYEVAELELEEKAGLCSQDQETGSTQQQANNEPLQPLEAAKVVLRLLPVWTMLLMFAVIFQQPATFFTKQGMTMRRNIGKSFKIPPAALQSSITISIIILMPWYNRLFIPLVQSLRRSEKGISVMERMGIGMFLSVVAMVIAALTERWRLHICQDSCEEVALSIFWLLPQYILLGISDIFTVVGMQEYFYSEVPTSMRTMGIALYTSVFGVGSFVSAILISVIERVTSGGGGQGSWFSDDMAQARLDKYYWFLGFWSAFSLLAFLVFCKFSKR